MQIESFRIGALADLHVHVRQGDCMKNFVRASERYADTILVMPNTDPPIDDPAKLSGYYSAIMACRRKVTLRVLPVFYIQANLDVPTLDELSRRGAVAGKLYPRGVTNNSSHGLSWEEIANSSTDLRRVLAQMEHNKTVLCVHAEAPASFCDNLEHTETAWISVLKDWVTRFPRLRIVVEHITTARMAEFILSRGAVSNLAATITPQHLMWHHGDLFGGGLLTARFCKPENKFPPDLRCLWKAIAESRYFFLGSDSAPHRLDNKASLCCSCGVYSAEVLPELLAEIFEANNMMGYLARFACTNGLDFYGLERTSSELLLERKPWTHAGNPEYPSPWDGHSFSWKCTRLSG